MTRKRLPLNACIVAVATALLFACTGNGSAPLSADQLVPNTPASGLPPKATTEADLDSSSVGRALPSDPDQTTADLAQNGFQSGFERVWGKADGDYETIAVLVFDSNAHANTFLGLERTMLAGSVNTYVTDHKEIPGSYVYVISGQTRVGDHSVICNGVWFVLRQYAVDSMICSATPSFATQAESEAKRVYDTANSRLSA